MEVNSKSSSLDEENKRAYAVDDDFNKVEVYSKDDMDVKIQGKILSGTTKPSNSLGEDGDIYLQYE